MQEKDENPAIELTPPPSSPSSSPLRSPGPSKPDCGRGCSTSGKKRKAASADLPVSLKLRKLPSVLTNSKLFVRFKGCRPDKLRIEDVSEIGERYLQKQTSIRYIYIIVFIL